MAMVSGRVAVLVIEFPWTFSSMLLEGDDWEDCSWWCWPCFSALHPSTSGKPYPALLAAVMRYFFGRHAWDFINKDTLIHSPTKWLMRNRELAFGLDRTDDGERSPRRRRGDKSELGLALDKPKLSNAPPMQLLSRFFPRQKAAV